tara:strand:- start:189 stop:761 length:573 start_codon:yes stop_codon:yes gene_type:complete
MKFTKLLLILIFSFQSWTKADDIRDFQIEGMSIGDSLLDYFSEEKIKKSPRYDHTNSSWTSDKMFQLRTGKKGPYTEILFALKKNDKKYIIYGISGLVKMKYNISDCYPKLKKVSKDLKELFPNTKIRKGNKKHSGDTSGKSKIKYVNFNFSSGDYASASCYDWSKKMGYWDNFRISIVTNEFEKWLKIN